MNILDLVIVVAAVAYGIGGFRHGAVVGALSMIGFFGGAAIGAQLAEPLGSRLADGRAQVPVAILCVLMLAMIGQLIGAWIAGHVRAKLVTGRGKLLDSGVGTGLGVASVLIVAWMVAVPLASSPYPQLSAEASHSTIVRAVNDVMPAEVRNLYGSMRSFLNQSGFPPVFGDNLGGAGPSVSVPAPDANLSPAVQSAVQRAHRSTFKIYGQAPSCNRGIEGSGFVIAPHKVITNAHVVAGTNQVSVQLANKRMLPATVVLFDPRTDVAVLNVPQLDAPVMHFASGTADQGTPAVVLGFPQNGPFTVRAARIRTEATVGGTDIYGHGSVDRQIYSLRAIIRSGNSGGPLIANDGSVLGMVFATALDSSDTGYALTAGQLARDVSSGRHDSAPVGTGSCTPE
ncbi:MAG TPA: MarP family serine protease [Jatrophihabitantaceae bacterium]|nr:MarP family serine protease [Jatrophihabitantaceae bacterium]